MEIEELNTNQVDNTDKDQVFDKSRAKKNIIISIIFKVVLLVLSLVAKRFLIRYAGDDYNGLNSLFTGIVGFLAIADLGIGTAIIYCMYEPIANNNVLKIRQLYTLFKKLYLIIGTIILGAGFIVSFFLPFLAKGYDADSTLYIGYYFSLVAVVVTYFYSAKLSLINAYKNNYISTTITSLGLVIQYILQIIFLVMTKSFIVYCSIKLIGSLIQLIAFSLYNKNRDITKGSEKIDDEVKKEVTKNVRAMFLHKIGDVIFSTVDSLVISSIIGVVVLGYYSNYLTILTAMNELLKLFIIPLTSIIGHMGVKASNKEKQEYFHLFYGTNFLLGAVFYLGYYAISSDLVTILFGEGLTLDNNVIIIITITYFIQFMRQSASTFKDSFGLFYKDRWMAIISAVVNAGLSIAFAYLFGIYGVLIATIVVDLLIYHVIEPLTLFKYGLDKTPLYYYFMNYFLIAFFVGEVLLLSLIKIECNSNFVHLLIMGFISVLINIISTIIVLFNNQIRKRVVRFVKNRLHQIKEKTKNREFGLDLLKIIALLLICFSHTVTIRNLTSFPKYSLTNIGTLFCNPFGDIGNALFIICSSYFLVDKTKTRTEKVIKILLDSSLISICFLIGFYVSGTELGFKTIVLNIFPDLFALNWFTPCYIVFYLLSPIIVMGLKKLSAKSHFALIIGSLIVYGALSLYGLNPIGSKLLQFFYILNIIAFIKWHKPSLFDNKKVNILGLIFGVLITFSLYFVAYFVFSEYSFYEKINLTSLYSPFLIITCISLFSLFKQIKIKNSFVSYLSDLSLFVYVIHENYLLRNITRVDYYNYVLTNYNGNSVFLWVLLLWGIMFFGGYILAFFYNETLSNFTNYIALKVDSILKKIINALFNKFVDPDNKEDKD